MIALKITSIFFFLFPPNQAFLQNSFHECNMSPNEFSISKPCVKKIHSGLQCVAKRIYETSYDWDRKLRVVFNFRDMPKYIKQFCSLKFNTSCKIASDDMQNIEAKCKYSLHRINFMNYESCSVYKGFITSKLMQNLLSLYCQETDKNRGLIPSYGPQLKCYQAEFVFGREDLNILDYQVKYCKKFQYSTLKECTIKRIDSVSNDEYLNGKSLFREDALKKLNTIKYFCEELLKIPKDVLDSCSREKINKCNEKAYVISAKPNTTYTPGTYLDCVSEIYRECRPDLGDLVKVIQLNIQSSVASTLTRMSCMVFLIISICSSSFKLIVF